VLRDRERDGGTEKEQRGKTRRERKNGSTSACSIFPPYNLFFLSSFNNKQQGHLLKDQLEVVKVPPADGVGRPRYTIKPIEDELPFDKVWE